MCVAVTCSSCGKVGWRGCGAHVEQVLRGVPEEKRCQCQAKKQQSQPADVQRSVMDWIRGR